MIDRRTFLRLGALLGGSTSGTRFLEAMTRIQPAAAGAGAAAVPAAGTAPAAGTLPFPPVDPDARRGGTLRAGQMVGRMEDPATYSWNEMSNQTRPILEYLTMVGPDNVLRPMLMDWWKPSSDLKTWTLHVREGVMWHNGEELSAEQVAWNIRRWTDPTLGSSNLGLATFAALTELTDEAGGKRVQRPLTNGVEVLDTHTLRLNLGKPVLSVPEDFAEYPTHIAHPSFRAPLSKHPLGTGPYTLAQLRVGERCILKRVTRTTDGREFRYWGGDVYLDEIHFYHFEQENQTAALASGSVDATYELPIEELELAQSIPGAQISSVESAQTLCCRMQVDVKPFDDIRVRRALILAADNGAIGSLVFGQYGSAAANYHVAPVHPEYFPLDPIARDVREARRLLSEAGHENGIDLTITVGNNDGPWQQSACEVLRDQVKEAGIRLAVNVVPATKYWEIWKSAPFAATSWSHRPLGTMALSQGYRTGASWNETHFSDAAFDRALAEAEAILDVAARRLKMREVERILRDACVMVQPFWRPVFILASSKVHGYRPHPARQMQLTKAWMS